MPRRRQHLRTPLLQSIVMATEPLLVARGRVATTVADRCCYVVDRVLAMEEVDAWRHHHCEFYDACLENVCDELPKGMLSWICGTRCPGRKTWKPYKKGMDAYASRETSNSTTGN